MKRLSWQILLGISLLLLSGIVYFLHYLIFKDAHHIFIYLLGDVGFVFIEVLLVTLIIHRVLQQKEKNSRLAKLNMVIGAFFSEVGSSLLEILSELDPKIERLQQELVPEVSSAGKEFLEIRRFLVKHDYDIEAKNVDWKSLKMFLVEKRDFLLRLLENPNLLEHESFTDLLWAVFHLTEELGARENLQDLPDEDYKHLYGDMKRVYGQLARQWLAYMEHLKVSYPYLFSLALRMNPFNRNASPVLR
ncbi:MAG: hypothetical protein P9M03_02925 [Candidatus Theseobacter exili]|nr:hypothetical protein [Candidatus Theseobacter exili]